jgi:hypothetical protein
LLTTPHHTAGPFFANEFYDESDLPDDGDLEKRSFKCIFECALTVAKSAPCFFEAMKAENPLIILKCVSKTQVGPSLALKITNGSVVLLTA